ncbi:MAG: hypothetical protein Tsb0017_04800 [Geothermobacteraceae bacterium]
MAEQLPYQLWRQDDNGIQFLVASFASLDEAQAMCDRFSARGHKQIWWVETVRDTTAENLLSNLPDDLPLELFTPLLQRGRLKLERIISRGHTTPEGTWYDQDHDEWVLLLSGRARLILNQPEEEIDLVPGSHLLIPARRKHRVSWTDPDQATVWLALHLPPEQETD